MITYNKYKPSGIDWIGDIPEHWKLKRLKFFAKVNSIIPSYEINKNHIKEVVFLPMEKVSEGGKITQDLRKKINEVSSGFTYFEKGDVILAKITPCFENGKGALLDNLQTDFGFGSTEFHTIRASETVSSKLLFYITKSHRFRTLGEAFMSGSAGQKRVSTDFVKDFQIALPPLDEQTAIADFLDEKTAKIDSLVENKLRLIELLKEERTAIINRAVTRGTNENAKLKPSGIAWLGDIPEHWTQSKIGYISRIVRGASPRPAGDPELFDGNHTPWITVAEVTKDASKFITGVTEYLTEEGAKQSRFVEIGTLLLSNSGATLGVPKILKIGGCINDGSVAFLDLNEKVSINFLYYFFISHTEIYREQASGSGQPNLNTDIVKGTNFAFPSTEEQKQIVEFIETATSKIDATIATIKKEIGFLGEYRTALISEVVTGKIKVI